MQKNLSFTRIISLIVFLIATVVYLFSVERTGSLWDCGEFILGAYKMQVVHPPGAPMFLLVGRIFALLGDITSSEPSNIAFAVNFMNGMLSAMVATFVSSITMMLTRYLNLASEDGLSHKIQVGGAGLASGLATAFCSTVWFSAVEGEVYAMSTFFTALTFWSVVKWYTLEDTVKNDRWLALAAYSAGLSIGVHLLSLLTFPALALLVYFKKVKEVKLLGLAGAFVAGAALIPLIQKLIITGIPSLWLGMEKVLVNGIGLPFQTGIIPTLLIVMAVFYGLFRYAYKKQNRVLELFTMCAMLVTIGYSTIGVVVIRANADTPVNMNVPSDASRLLPYINREQYGERALLFGPSYEASPVSYERKDRYGREDLPPYYSATANDDEYIVVDEKIKPVYDGKDKMLFPRISDANLGRPRLYKEWYQSIFGDTAAKPSFGFNVAFFIKYQINWMYFRYFSWNFIGRQNGDQGFYAWDKSSGNWRSGIKFIDESKLYNLDEEPDTMKYAEANNNYYFLPLIFGLIGLFFHLARDQKTFFATLILFLITGLGIILYSNQPPNEPRERDYVLVGSFFTFCIWIGLAIPAIVTMLKERVKLSGIPISAAAAVIVLLAPTIMAFENYDDHSRMHHMASRDYASNFLNSLEPNAIIFTYGDNDTYPLWYAQEVENIRTDVRIVNLSLIQVDWYINKLRRKVNDSEPLKLSISPEAYRGNRRNQIPFYLGDRGSRPMDLSTVIKFIGDKNELKGSSMTFESFVPTKDMLIPTNMSAIQSLNFFTPGDSVQIVPAIQIKFPESKNWIVKDELAILDVISSNIWERPIYFATTCKNEKLLGLNDYMQYEGLALRLVPTRTPSDKSMSIYGSGRIETTKVYNNIMNKFKWGNFDKKDLFVDNSYGAAVQAHRMVFNRTCDELLKEGKVEQAVALADKYFEAFPHMNFPYDASIVSFINIYLRTRSYDKAKKHLRILANETADHLNFYESIDPDIVKSSFQQEYILRLRASQNILSVIDSIPDDEFQQEIKSLLERYRQSRVPN
jgi:hypothetical protein